MWVTVLSSAITATATLVATAVGWSLHQKGTKADARRDLYEGVLLMINEFEAARYRGERPPAEWLEKFGRHFVKVELLDSSTVRRCIVLIYDMIMPYLAGNGNFDKPTFDARRELLAGFMRYDLNRKARGDPFNTLEHWRKSKGLDESRESLETSIRTILGFDSADTKDTTGSL